jgi:hypothetical protein
MSMEHFFNEGFGWTCRRCHAETKACKPHTNSRARFFNEGEAEERDPKLSAPALARWRDASRRALVCPRCEIEEILNGI